MKNNELLKEISNIYSLSRRTYGSPRIHASLKTKGIKCSKGLVEKMMRTNKIISLRRKKYIATTDSKHNEKIAPNLLKRNFKVNAPNKVWVSDITYLWTKQGWLYLSVTLDLFSRRVIGWSMGEKIDTALSTSTLGMALSWRGKINGLIHHSDRGKEYSCKGFRAKIKENKIQQSMSRKGDCWDNAVAESFFKSLKAELGSLVSLTKEQAKNAVFEWIEVFYNRQRLHSTLGYLAPAVYEEKYVA